MTEYEEYLSGLVAETFADNELQWKIFVNRFGVMFWKGYKLKADYIEQKTKLFSHQEFRKTNRDDKVCWYVLNELTKFKNDYLKVIDKKMNVDCERIYKDYKVNKKYRWSIKKTLDTMYAEVKQDEFEITIKDLWLIKNYLISFVKNPKVRKEYCLKYLIDLERKDDNQFPWTYVNQQRTNFLSI